VKVILSNSGVDYEYKKVELGKYQFSLSVEQIYSEFLNAVLMLLKGNLEAGRFEDRCRTTLGNDSFIFFSFDKLVNSAARALQVLASDENSSKLLGLFSKYMKISQNEEMYSADCFHICNPAPVFRIHWNPDFKIMSVTFVESPFEKINELTVKNAQKYQKHFLNTRLQINTFDEIKNFIKRFHLYMGNDIAYPYLKDLVSFSHVKSFMIENSYRFYYLPGNEDFILNTSFYAHYTVLICDGESFLCKDKNSLFQKITENSEKKLNDFRNSWIGC
jgi:histone deacetylase complex regulatory component SIN3